MRLVLISDTHNMHDLVKVPDGDVLVHAGDLTLQGTDKETDEALRWLINQPHKRKIIIAGNHDWYFSDEERSWLQQHFSTIGITYLEDSGTEIDGVKFWGSPVQPWFCDWAFNRHRGADIKKHWDLIPNATDVLITHGPPFGILDQSAPHLHTDHLGCEELLLAIERVQPTLHVFGHIHGSYGREVYGPRITCVNASVVNEAYRVANAPIVVDI